MLANVALSLRDELNQVSFSPDTQENILIAAGKIIARYVEETPFTRENGTNVTPLHLTPELLINADAYPRLKFIVDKARLEDAIDILRAIDMKAPTMQGVTFNQLICCNEDSCMIVINAGAPLVSEFARVIADKLIAAPRAEQPAEPTPNGAVR